MRERLPLILSTSALLVAVIGTPLGQAAYDAVVPRNSVGAAQLRKGAVTNVKLRGDAVTSGKVKNRSLRAIDFADGQLPAGPVGPKGEKGDKGSKGDTGEPGAPGLSGYQVVANVLPASSGINISGKATCPAGKVPIGGGASPFSWSPANGPFIVRSLPDTTGWNVLLSQSPTITTVVTVYAVCATVSP